ncbi:GntR family transcriptional regulator [Derxia lacustris]|uniref:GntR family transcriptional regulator n=1 Tax=Derxia lacustris TaxID=764842 RepID=UPI000A172B07|nr:GntR family transcriptional regulator [Derxia lacustris]
MNSDDASLGSAIDDEVYEAIFDAVMTRRLPPAARLTEAPLCEVFGTTRAVVRRVFVRLAHERVIELQPNRGASVASPDIEQTRAVFEARRVIEAGLVRKLAAQADKRWLAGLRALAAEEHAAFERGDRSAWIELSGSFHLRLAEAAGNDELRRMLKTLVARTSLMIALYQSAQASLCASDEHVQLLDAIERGDAAGAVALSDEHLLHCERQLKLETEPDEPDLAAVFASYARSRKSGRAAG